MELLNIAQNVAVNGFQASEVTQTILRVSMGTFFMISGFNKLFVPDRHATLRRSLIKNKVPAINFNEWWVPAWEFIGGLMLAVGLFSGFAATVLAIIIVVAICCEAKERVEAYHPINKGDVVADYLYLPEVLYLICLAGVILGGAGMFRLDTLLF